MKLYWCQYIIKSFWLIKKNQVGTIERTCNEKEKKLESVNNIMYFEFEGSFSYFSISVSRFNRSCKIKIFEFISGLVRVSSNGFFNHWSLLNIFSFSPDSTSVIIMNIVLCVIIILWYIHIPVSVCSLGMDIV